MRHSIESAENKIIGFEPWEDFPFNRGMLCPKGVKRYMQSGHPDRLLHPLMRGEYGFRPATWDKRLTSRPVDCARFKRNTAKMRLLSMVAHRSPQRNPICWENLPA